MEPIILLHGALGTARTLLPLSKILDAVAEVHILDFPDMEMPAGLNMDLA